MRVCKELRVKKTTCVISTILHIPEITTQNSIYRNNHTVAADVIITNTLILFVLSGIVTTEHTGARKTEGTRRVRQWMDASTLRTRSAY